MVHNSAEIVQIKLSTGRDHQQQPDRNDIWIQISTPVPVYIYSVFTVAPELSVHTGNYVRAGIGPAFYLTRSWTEQGGGVNDIQSTFKVGFLTYAGISFPPKTRLFINMDLQYRFVGAAKIGPFKITSFNNSATFNEAKVNYNHLFVSAGIGFRFNLPKTTTIRKPD
jgi:opacity protein-like surface antigen